MFRRLRGFTLIELLVAVLIIAVLATLVVLSLGGVEAHSRDANRRDSVSAYATAMEEWRTLSPTKSYFVQYLSTGSSSCAASNPNNTNHTKPLSASYGYMTGTQTSCVGYDGGGAGRITRKGFNTATGFYTTNSVADALVQAGVLNAIRVDPFMQNKPYTDNSQPQYDFILTTCDRSLYAASAPANALTYGIFTYLESPSTSETTIAQNQCGGTNTGNSWQIDL